MEHQYEKPYLIFCEIPHGHSYDLCREFPGLAKYRVRLSLPMQEQVESAVPHNVVSQFCRHSTRLVEEKTA